MQQQHRSAKSHLSEEEAISQGGQMLLLQTLLTLSEHYRYFVHCISSSPLVY